MVSSSLIKSIQIPDDQFLKQISREHHWAPVAINHWSYLPSFHQLPADVRLRYNQLHALSIGEIFCYFEQEFVKKVMTIKRDNMKSDAHTALLGEAMKHLCDEEDKHSEMFWRLNQAAAPELYPTRKYLFIEQDKAKAKIRDFFIVNMIDQLLFWVWTAIFFEERTLMFSVEYAKDENQNLSPQFRKIHELHMIEESRHVVLDEIFIDLFFKDQPFWKQKLGAKMFISVLRDFTAPRRSIQQIVKILRQEFQDPKIHQMFDQLMVENIKLRENKDYRLRLFGPQTARRTYKLMKEHRAFDFLQWQDGMPVL